MSLLIREKKDGRRAPGYLVYLLGGVAAVAAVVVLHSRVSSGDVRARSPGRRKSSPNLDAVTRSSAQVAPARVPDKAPSRKKKKYLLKAEKPVNGSGQESPASDLADTFDAISAALRGDPAPAPPAKEKSHPSPSESPPENSVDGYGVLPRALPMDAAGTGRGSLPGGKDARPELLGYRDPSADDAVYAGEGRPATGPPAPDDRFLPRGTLVAVCLLTTVDTSNPAAVIQFAAARDVFFNRRLQLAFGTRFLGRLNGKPLRGRLNLTADAVLFPNGLELPANAAAVEADDSGSDVRPGVEAAFYPPPAWAEAAPYVADFFGGLMGLMESRAQQHFTLGVGGVSVQASAPGDVRAPLYQASDLAVRDFAAARLKEVEDRYAAYYLVPAGTACWLQLDADLPLSKAPTAHENLPSN
jgi:hypothetical protein